MSEYSSETFAAILESLPNGVYVVDRNRRIQFWNAGAEHISGYLRQEVIGRLCPEDLLRHCDTSNRSVCGSNCPLLGTMHDGKPHELMGYLRHKDGHRVPVRIRSVPVRDGSGMIIGAAETFDVHIHSMNPVAVDTSEHPAEPAKIDPLTGIPDFTSWIKDLKWKIADYQEGANRFGVLGIAIDGMEAFTRSHGRKGTEAMLRVVASTLSMNLPPEDVLGKWTGDRFVVLVAACAPLALAVIADRLGKVLGMDDLPWWGDRLPISVTIGGTVIRPDDTAEAMLERVEQALAEALNEPRRSVNVI